MASSERLPFFNMYPNEFLTSHRVRTMTKGQRGGYMDLLCYCWESGSCSIKDDTATFQALSELNEEELPFVREMFESHPTMPGFVTNLRMYDEWIKARRRYDAKSYGGLSGGKTRRKERERTSKTHRTIINDTSKTHGTIINDTSKTHGTIINDTSKTHRTIINDTRLESDTNSDSSSSPPNHQNDSSSKKEEKKDAAFLVSLQDRFEQEFWKPYPARDGKKIGKAEAWAKYQQLNDDARALIAVAVQHLAAHSIGKSGIGIKDAHRWIASAKGLEPWREWIEESKPHGGIHVGLHTKDYITGTW